MRSHFLLVSFSALSLSLTACGMNLATTNTSPGSLPVGSQHIVSNPSRQVSPLLSPVSQNAAYDSTSQTNAMPTAAPTATPTTAPSAMPSASAMPSTLPSANTEDYSKINENAFLDSLRNPLSTFSIDVDTASYTNVRRMLQNGQRPSPDAVRIEEFLNYFRYDYARPTGDAPFGISTEQADCPWAPGHKLLQIGLQAPDIDFSQAAPNNLVFLIDTSGSMGAENKLPLVKQSLRLLVNQMRPQDRIAIVTYAGSAGLALPSTSGENKERILDALLQLGSGGSTAGGAGIQLAYQTARQALISNGNNRVILATDGDFNVGVSSDADLQNLIEAKRREGIFLTVLGYGMGNYKDNKLEILANKGNGNYAYIDSLIEARKVLVKEMGSTLFTVAKDVKLQVEFNPAKVARYRLIGYENRLLAAEDFDNDAKDAGELGAGHTVTALYEIEPTDGNVSRNPLTYSETQIKEGAYRSNDLLTLKLRYKQPQSETSQLLTQSIADSERAWTQASPNLRFAASVAGFGMLLRQSAYKGSLNYEQVYEMGKSAIGDDTEGYRKAYLELVQRAMKLTPAQ